MRGRFAEAQEDAVHAEIEVRERRELERSYRRMLAMTDGLIGKLEGLNLKGQTRVGHSMRRQIETTVEQLTPRAQRRFPGCRTVQQALDGMFDVQEELLLAIQRMLRWDQATAIAWESMVDNMEKRTA